jgi:hypothetical protein
MAGVYRPRHPEREFIAPQKKKKFDPLGYNLDEGEGR